MLTRIAPLILCLFLLSTIIYAANSPNGNLQVHAVTGNNNASIFQCWEVNPPFSISQQAGTVGAKIQQLGIVQGASVVFFNEKNVTYAGLHPAPSPQWVLILAGGGTVTLPTNNQKLDIAQGSIIIASDTANVSELGHNSDWVPGTIAVQLPFENGFLNHTVLHNGLCNF
ncbi:hypothetical protein M422DRAFT_50475 [Sphaerobolus stellatus SS14]|uniref:Cupin type-1 domain-containing protein n=1 Tax=Sphaerobolus stellatus (strain SS14) TaxID=990650 RepID=A0A0C9V7C2_SPHS4|nr:hypothetical protein M422DRAFT_50475 [Sphaerobolus stellatus SS14]